MRLPPLPEPPRPPARTPFPIVAVVAPVLGAVVIGLVLSSPFMLLFAALGPIVAIAGVVDGRRNARRHRRHERERFDRECALFEQAIDQAHRAERLDADERARALRVRWRCPSLTRARASAPRPVEAP